MTSTIYQHWLYRAFSLRDDFMESFLVMYTNLAWQPKTSSKVAVIPNIVRRAAWIFNGSHCKVVQKPVKHIEDLLTFALAFAWNYWLPKFGTPSYLFTNQKICMSKRDWLTWINGKFPAERQRRNCFSVPDRKGSEIEKELMSWVSKLFICTFLNNCTQTFCYLKSSSKRMLYQEIEKLQSNLKQKSISVDSSNIIDFFCDIELIKHRLHNSL